MGKVKRVLSDCYLALIILFMYAPIFTLVVLSFNEGRSRAQWSGFSLHWYEEMLANDTIMAALRNTLVIALISAFLATVLGTMAAIAISNMHSVSRNIIMSITNIPMLNADIVTGISLMLSFIAFGISLGFKTILISHITFNIPYVILSVLPKVRGSSKDTYEAALDLGATPMQAFWKVVLPEIMPGVTAGFMLAFTMSLDDFIITHFTRGAGIDTISTLVYSQVRKGISPALYALSTVIFVTVFIVLVIGNFAPDWIRKRKHAVKKIKYLRTLMVSVLAALSLGACGTTEKSIEAIPTKDENTLYVYNWGEYIDPDVIDQFEEETGINVVYDLFQTNEEMYPVIEAGGVLYDAVCPSDYMIKKMAQNGLLAELDKKNIPNLKEIGTDYLKMAEQYDPGNTYSVPYVWGTVGILYNKRMLDELGVPYPTSWKDLWNPKLKNEILMQDSVRDAFMVALKKNGYSCNTKNPAELDKAMNDLIAQKPLVQAYVVDQVRDKMIGEEAAVGVIYSGEILYIKGELEGTDVDVEYVIPKEGTNLWMDGWVIPKNARHKELAEKWINFLCRPDVAAKNFEYITYSTPNVGACALLDKSYLENKAVFPDTKELLKNSEFYDYMGKEVDRMYNDRWKTVKSS
ncbi:MAG TPA: spermidine/putrescine ABC transporter permease/substrate-binding protein PotCD [Oribacterium sp.]|jgi:spermidine/putrescine transport system permease protein|nr:spermidine/putrescine ABC transporter permease/substrate-binding protein PotCD [Oribacterium sp.]